MVHKWSKFDFKNYVIKLSKIIAGAIHRRLSDDMSADFVHNFAWGFHGRPDLYTQTTDNIKCNF